MENYEDNEGSSTDASPHPQDQNGVTMTSLHQPQPVADPTYNTLNLNINPSPQPSPSTVVQLAPGGQPVSYFRRLCTKWLMLFVCLLIDCFLAKASVIFLVTNH